MKNTIVKQILLCLILLNFSHQSYAWEVDVEVDINTSTNYRDCQEYADDIVDLVKLFIRAENDDDRTFIDKQIKFLKKNLKKCEKMNKESSNKIDTSVKVGIKYDFSKQ